MTAKIRMQAVLLSIVPLVFLLLLVGLAAVLQNRTQQSATMSRHSDDVLTLSDRVVKTLDDGSRSIIAYVGSRHTADLAGYRESKAQLPTQLRQLRALVKDNPAQERRATLFSNRLIDGMNLLAVYLRDEQIGAAGSAKALAGAPSTQRLSRALRNAKDDLDSNERQLEIGRFNDLHRNLRFFGWILLGVSALGIMLTLFTTARFGLHIAQRLERLAENARRLGTGAPTIPIGGNDEIARLDRVYHQMTRRIQDTLTQKNALLAAYQREHHVASTLQRALLAQDLPDIRGIRIDTAYVPASEASDVGGDWYDAFVLSANLVAISVGDVAGHGLRAATIMGAVRQAIRTVAREGSNPSTVLGVINRTVCAENWDMLVTAFYGVLDLRDGSLSYAIAGHPAPIVAGAGRKAAFLPGRGLMLGVEPDVSFRTYEAGLTAGSMLVLYTDGLIENERDLFKGFNTLELAIAKAIDESADNPAEAIQKYIFKQMRVQDDSAILTLRIDALGVKRSSEVPRSWTFDARNAAEARRVRSDLVRHVTDASSSDADLSVVELIFSELVGNIAKHTPGHAEVTAGWHHGALKLTASDRGDPFDSRGRSGIDPLSESGRGLFLVHALAGGVRSERHPSGNTVTVILPEIEPRGDPQPEQSAVALTS